MAARRGRPPKQRGWVLEREDEYSTPGARSLARERTRDLVPLAADYGLVVLLSSAYLQGIRDCVEVVGKVDRSKRESVGLPEDVIPGLAL